MTSGINNNIVVNKVFTVTNYHDAIAFSTFDKVAMELCNSAFAELHSMILVLGVLYTVVFNPVVVDFRSLGSRSYLDGFPSRILDDIVVYLYTLKRMWQTCPAGSAEARY